MCTITRTYPKKKKFIIFLSLLSLIFSLFLSFFLSLSLELLFFLMFFPSLFFFLSSASLTPFCFASQLTDCSGAQVNRPSVLVVVGWAVLVGLRHSYHWDPISPSTITAEFVLDLCMCPEFVFVFEFVLGLCHGCGLIGLWPVD